MRPTIFKAFLLSNDRGLRNHLNVQMFILKYNSDFQNAMQIFDLGKDPVLSVTACSTREKYAKVAKHVPETYSRKSLHNLNKLYRTHAICMSYS